MLKLVTLAPCSRYRLYVVFADGVEGEVDLSHLAGKGIFKAWKDQGLFNSVHIGEHGEIRWNDEIELCPDAVYLQLTGKTAEEVFQDMKVSTDA